MNFSRISGAVDVSMLSNTHIVGIGAGGAYCLYEALVRSGLGRLTVFDMDTVDDVNLCRQGFLPDQIGKKKVIALEEHLLSINPDLIFTAIPWRFGEHSEAIKQATFGIADMFLFMTDSFEAQALGNKLAIEYQKPAIWGGYYAQSQCSEIVFYIPGVTPGCFRCAVAPRYEVQSQSDTEIKVSSACNTMFHSQMIDSMIGMLTMAILHNNIPGYTFSEWFGDKWDRNLIQFKVSPDYESKLFDRMLVATEGRALLFNAVWQQIESDGCEDCTQHK